MAHDLAAVGVALVCVCLVERPALAQAPAADAVGAASAAASAYVPDLAALVSPPASDMRLWSSAMPRT